MKVNEIKIYLLDYNQKMTSAWNNSFRGIENVEVINTTFEDFVASNQVEVIVSPANAYGLMDGGYDLAISKVFGYGLQLKVQKAIIEKFNGEQPTAIVLNISINEFQQLYHIPSMRIPQKITDYGIIYQCTRAVLMEAINNNVKNIVIPAFGGECGMVPYVIIADMMRKAYDQLNENVTEINWGYASQHAF